MVKYMISGTICGGTAGYFIGGGVVGFWLGCIIGSAIPMISYDLSLVINKPLVKPVYKKPENDKKLTLIEQKGLTLIEQKEKELNGKT